MAETVGALGTGLAVAPGTVGACVVADREILLGCVEQKLAEDGAAPGTVTVRRVVRALAGRRGFVADLGGKSAPAGCNTVPGPENHILQAPAVRRNPSKDKTAQLQRHCRNHWHKRTH